MGKKVNKITYLVTYYQKNWNKEAWWKYADVSPVKSPC